ncbi:hypothetical protein KZ848_29220, partial [Pseudomonas aeruginosa]
MTDRYIAFANSPVGRRLVGAVGPSPPPPPLFPPPRFCVYTRLELFLYLTAISLGFAFLQGIIQIGHILMVEEVVLRRVLRY